jgi:hypothetical protein
MRNAACRWNADTHPRAELLLLRDVAIHADGKVLIDWARTKSGGRTDDVCSRFSINYSAVCAHTRATAFASFASIVHFWIFIRRLFIVLFSLAAARERMCMSSYTAPAYSAVYECRSVHSRVCTRRTGNENSANWGELFIFALRWRKPAAELYARSLSPCVALRNSLRERSVCMWWTSGEVIWYNKLLNSKCSEALRSKQHIQMKREQSYGSVFVNFCIVWCEQMNIPRLRKLS